MEAPDWVTLTLIVFVAMGISHFFFEGYYWWRTFVSYFTAKYIKKRSHVLDKTSVSGSYES